MAKPKMILGGLVFYGLLVWSAISVKVDHVLLWFVGGTAAAAVLLGAISWIAGEVSLWYECVRSNPPVPQQKPAYWSDFAHEKKDADA